jgi:pyridoxine 4-dehydrogenase
MAHQILANLQRATYYGTPTFNSLHVLRYYFEKYPEDASKVVLSIKGAYSHEVGPIGDAEGIRASVDQALEILAGTKQIDVFELGRSVSYQGIMKHDTNEYKS